MQKLNLYLRTVAELRCPECDGRMGQPSFHPAPFAIMCHKCEHKITQEEFAAATREAIALIVELAEAYELPNPLLVLET